MLVGYVRVSTDEQGASGIGLEAQRDALTAYAAGRPLELFTDIASGAAKQRPGLKEALLVCKRTPGSVLVVAKLDRLSRSVLNFCEILQDLEQHQTSFVALDLGLDTSTLSGKMAAQMMAVFAEYERGMISRRQRDAYEVRRRQGQGPGTTRPFGRPKKLPDSTIRLIWQLHIEDGLSSKRIAQRLEQLGIPTATGRSRWHPSLPKDVLRRYPEADWYEPSSTLVPQ